MNEIVVANAPYPSRSHERQAALDGWTHLKRVGDPSEFASAIRFLVADESSYVTGASLHVDGGFHRFAVL